jgi:hypothetical protein
MDVVDVRAEGKCTEARLWDSHTRTISTLGGSPEG